MDAVLVIEALPPVTNQELEADLNELAELIGRYCGADTSPTILAEDHREIDI